MTRQSKQGERRAKRPHRRKAPAVKTGPLTENLPGGFKPHENAIAGSDLATRAFVPKIKGL